MQIDADECINQNQCRSKRRNFCSLLLFMGDETVSKTQHHAVSITPRNQGIGREYEKGNMKN